MKKPNLLASLPAVDELLRGPEAAGWLANHPRSLVVRAIRETIQAFRVEILETKRDTLSSADLHEAIGMRLAALARPHFRRVVNATGVVLHTNLGRAPLPPRVLEHVARLSSGYSNLEFDLEAGRRGKRYSHVVGILREITGAEDALIVNNNAAAVLLSLTALAAGREVIVSRGELIEIGGSFRIPDVMKAGGAKLVEVGATNKTHLRDYEKALSDQTALLLKVHPSNYRMVGFVDEVSIEELVALGRSKALPVMFDLGSGCLLDISRFGITGEPTVQTIIRGGADVVTFSGDKLLGGPQGGIIVGRKTHIQTIQKHPFTRAVRVDKMTLAALEATLMLYRDEDQALREIPTLAMLSMPHAALRRRAAGLAASLRKAVGSGAEIRVFDDVSRAGGGSLPEKGLKTSVVSVRPISCSVNDLESRLRAGNPPVVARIQENTLLLDPRTIQPDETRAVVQAVSAALVPPP